MEEINLTKIRGKYQERIPCESCKKSFDFACSRDYIASGDDTVESIKIVAERLNELIKDYKYVRSLVLPLE